MSRGILTCPFGGSARAMQIRRRNESRAMELLAPRHHYQRENRNAILSKRNRAENVYSSEGGRLV